MLPASVLDKPRRARWAHKYAARMTTWWDSPENHAPVRVWRYSEVADDGVNGDVDYNVHFDWMRQGARRQQ